MLVPTGSVVVQGTYLKQVKIVQHGIHFIDDQLENKVYQYSHLVVATTLSLHPVPCARGRRKWRLDSDEHQRILHVIEERAEPLELV